MLVSTNFKVDIVYKLSENQCQISPSFGVFFSDNLYKVIFHERFYALLVKYNNLGPS